MNARFRPLHWTPPSTPDDKRRSRWTFKASWADTLAVLERELGYLDAHDVVIEADFTEADIRLDGWPRANARNPVHPGIRIAFDSVHGLVRVLAAQRALDRARPRGAARGRPVRGDPPR
jgi:hypothetical protein